MLDVLGLSNQIEDKSKIPFVIEKYNRLINEVKLQVNELSPFNKLLNSFLYEIIPKGETL